MFGQPISREKIMMFSRDGVFDIAVGVMLIAAGAYLYFDLVALGGIIAVLVLPIIQGLKRAITVPRLAAVDLPEDAEMRVMRGFWLASVLIGVATLAAVAIYGFGRAGRALGWLDDVMPYALLSIVGIFLLVGAYTTRNWRLIGYAVLIAATYAVVRWFEIALWLGLVSLGGVTIVIGVALALYFVQTHPVVPPDQRVQFR